MDTSVADIDRRYKEGFAFLADKHGSPFRIPADELHLLGERTRAEHVVAIHGKADPIVLRGYSIPVAIIEELCGEAPVAEPRRPFRLRKETVERWCLEHVGTTVSPQVIATVGEFSEATARTFIADRPDLFSKVRRGHYLVRDPKAERQGA
jgi:hypothetical protein